MLFNLIFVILIAYLIISPYFYAKAMKFGMKIMAKPEETADAPMFDVKVPKKKPKMTPQQDRLTQILRNIDHYNGSSDGQVKVEVKKK